MTRAIDENANQYCRSGGENTLVTALAKHYSPLLGREINPMTEVTITGINLTYISTHIFCM